MIVITRNDIVAKAREFIGVPFQHQGRIKGRGIDCVGVPICVAAELGLLDKRGNRFDVFRDRDYPAQPTGDLVLRLCRMYLIEKGIDAMDQGDVLCLRLPKDPVHTAIVSSIGGRPGMIHVYDAGRGGCVVENLIDDAWNRRIVAVFSFPGM